MVHLEALQSFSPSDTGTSRECKLCCALSHGHHDSLTHKQVDVEDTLKIALLLDAEQERVECFIKKEQAHGLQAAALSQMQLQAMQKVEAQEKKLCRLSALLVEHQAIWQTLPRRLHDEALQVPQDNLTRFRNKVVGYVPDIINKTRGVASREGQVPDLNGSPTIKKTFVDILADSMGPVDTHHKWIGFADAVTSTPVKLEEPAYFSPER